jgi:outer membrane protein OmpA-like peptidoglycan-associated protein
MLLVTLAALAHAQDGGTIDAHGFHLVPSDGDRVDFLSTWRPELQNPGSFGVAAMFEAASQPLVLVSQSGPTELAREPLVDALYGVNLGATYSPVSRVSVSVALPVYFATVGVDGAEGPTVGDLRLAVPIAFVGPADPAASGFGLAAVPFVDVPTGADARFLGDNSTGGGLVIAPGYRAGPVVFAGNLGVDASKNIDFDNLHGGTHLVSSLAVGYEATEWLGLRGEVQFGPALSPNEVKGTDSPGEFLLSLRGRHTSGLSWTVGGAGGLTHGAGAATWRAFVGIGFTKGKPPIPDTDGDGILDPDDSCPKEPETVNAYLDVEGCPDALADVTVHVHDDDGKPVPNAAVTLGDQKLTTDANGDVHLPAPRMPATNLGGSAVREDWFEDTAIAERALVEGPQTIDVDMPFKPGKVRVITKNEGGAIVDASVQFEGPAAMPTSPVGDDGTEVFSLRPGHWRLLLSAASFGTERRDLDIEPGQTSLVIIEVVMHPAKTEVVAQEIKILQQVNFDFNQSTIKADSFPLLDEVANVLLANPQIKKVEVQGHTDDVGSDSFNLELSQKRVDAVVAYLVAHGVTADRLVPVGYGKSQPLVKGTSDAARAANRRVQFKITDPSAPAEPTP